MIEGINSMEQIGGSNSDKDEIKNSNESIRDAEGALVESNFFSFLFDSSSTKELKDLLKILKDNNTNLVNTLDKLIKLEQLEEYYSQWRKIR